VEIAILLQFLAIERHFSSDRDWTREIAISPQFLAIELRVWTSFRAAVPFKENRK